MGGRRRPGRTARPSQAGSGTAARSHPGPVAPHWTVRGRGVGAQNTPPQPRRSFVPRYADGPRTAAPASVGFSFFVVRPVLFSPPLASRGERGRPRPSPPKPSPEPAVSGRPARLSRSRGGTRAPPARGTARLPRPDGPPGAEGPAPLGHPSPSHRGPLTCQQLLQALAEGLQLSLTREPLGAEELGDEGHGGGDLAYHGGGPGVEGMHGGGGARRRGPDGGAAPRAPSQVRGLRGREGVRGGRLLFFFFSFLYSKKKKKLF